MSIRIEIVLILLVMLLPFVLVNLLVSASRKALLLLLLATGVVAMLLACSGSTVVRSLLLVFGSQRFGPPIGCALFAGLLGYALMQRRTASRRQLDRIWVDQPSLNGFARYCTDRLRGSGWSITASHDDLLVVAHQIEQRIGRATLAIVVDDLSAARVGLIFRQRRWPLNTRRVLVTWFPPSPAFQHAAASDGWLALHGAELDRLAERLTVA